MTYSPEPVDTSAITLGDDLLDLTESLARHVHDIWARQRVAEGWTYGPQRSDEFKQHPSLVPYDELAESEKDYDRNSALEALKAIVAHGFHIVPRFDAGDEEGDVADDLIVGRGLESLLARLRAAENAENELAILLDVWNKRQAHDPLWRNSPEPYRQLGRRLVKLGAAPVAAEVARGALEFAQTLPDGRDSSPWAADVELRQIHGLSLARTANLEQAQRILHALHDEGNADEETLGMLARTYKDLATVAADEPSRRELLAQSQDLYEEAYLRTGGYWTGINVATLARLRGDDDRARAMAHRVRQQCLAALQPAREQNQDLYWILATLGEAALNLGEFTEAEDCYRQAYASAPKRFGDLNSTRRHARWLLQHWQKDPLLIDQWIQIPKVVVFAGHMIDQPGRPQPRFPTRMVEAVYAALHHWLHQEHALVGFSSAACGSDILFQQALHELGGESYVVLPYDADSFDVDSVSIIPGADWSQRFRNVLTRATQVITASPQKMQAGGVSYDYCNLLLHGLATVQARQLETPLVGLTVWNGRSGDGPGGTASVVGRCHRLRVPVYCVDPSGLSEHASVHLSGVAVDSPPDRQCEGPEGSNEEVSVMAMLFGDVVNFGKLTEEQVPRFVQHFLGPIGRLLRKRYDKSNVVRNTWGDGLYLVFNNVRDAGRCALEIRDFVNDRVRDGEWTRLKLPAALNVRIALHAGPVYRCQDPVTGQLNYTGTHVSRAARLEPKTPPGEVYASEAFAALSAVENVQAFTCEYVKQLEWAKHYGTFPTFVVRRRGKPPTVPQRQSSGPEV